MKLDIKQIKAEMTYYLGVNYYGGRKPFPSIIYENKRDAIGHDEVYELTLPCKPVKHET